MALRATILVLMVTLVVVASAGLLGELIGYIVNETRLRTLLRPFCAGDFNARARHVFVTTVSMTKIDGSVANSHDKSFSLSKLIIKTYISN